MKTGSDIVDYLTRYVDEMAFGDEEPGVVMDRYHTPDIEWFTDGRRLDRQRLVDHARPARKNAVHCEVDVHDAVVGEGAFAARYTISARLRKGQVVDTEIHMFARLARDGPISRVGQLTRIVRGGS